MPEGEELPSFVDEAFVQRALRSGGGGGGGEGTALHSVTFDPVGAAGDHYASTMFRATAKTDKGTKTLIVKTLPPGQLMKENMKEEGYFKVETVMFTEVIPKLEEILGAVEPNRVQPLASRCTYHGDDPEDFLVIEDLTPQGFVIADRHRGLDLNHCLLALRTLARFHAASAALLAREPALAAVLKNPFREDHAKMEVFETFIRNSFQSAADAMRSYADFPQEYADIAESHLQGIVPKMVNVRQPKENGLNVIAHGDFWVNNMMFRYENDEVHEIRFVDFQMSNVTSPALDILYFLSTSVSVPVFKTKVGLLLRQYLTTLNETLELLGLETYSAREFQDDLKERAFQAMVGTFMVLPIVKAEKAANFDDAITEGKTATNYLYASASYEKSLRCVIPEFHRRGWFVQCDASKTPPPT